MVSAEMTPNRFMADYVRLNVFPEDPFRSLDREGVGELLMIAAERSRETNGGVSLAICGEHGGDPKGDRILSGCRLQLRLMLPVPSADSPLGRCSMLYSRRTGR